MNKLNLIAPLGQTGYGVTGFNIAKELINQGWDLAVFPKGDPKRDDINVLAESIAKSKLFHHESPCLNIWHQFDLAVSIGKGPYYAFPIFELDRFNELERHHLAYPDKLFVCSEWAKGVIVKNLIRSEEDVHVVPLGIDPSFFLPNTSLAAKSDNVIFLNVGKWEVRKGHDFLIDIFERTFSPTDHVELWMMPYNPFINKEEEEAWHNHYLNTRMGKAGKVKIIPWQKSHADVAKIMSQANCGVFPSRAEGWNLELLEMMAMGKSVITTNYSAHSQFCNHTNAKLIQIDEVEPAYDGKWFFEQGNWAKIDEKEWVQLEEHMRSVYHLYHDSPDHINQSGIATGKIFTWNNTARQISKIMG